MGAEKKMTVSFNGQVAIVTGAGNGLGRSHALALAKRGAKVVVNDLGGSVDGSGASSDVARDVVATIKKNGGEAIAHGANVAVPEQVQDMVDTAMARWDRIDILVNNAGILRDKTLSKMTHGDFRAVMDVHLAGTFNCCKAVWDIMKAQSYGRIVMTSSASGIYGNFGQSNYGAAKMGMVGMMNCLVLEGRKYGIHVNCLAPNAMTRMTGDLIADQRVQDLLTLESVSAGLLALCAQEAPNRTILFCTAGGYSVSQINETDGIYLPPEQQTPEAILARWGEITDPAHQRHITNPVEPAERFVAMAAKELGVSLD